MEKTVKRLVEHRELLEKKISNVGENKRVVFLYFPAFEIHSFEEQEDEAKMKDKLEYLEILKNTLEEFGTSIVPEIISLKTKVYQQQLKELTKSRDQKVINLWELNSKISKVQPEIKQELNLCPMDQLSLLEQKKRQKTKTYSEIKDLNEILFSLLAEHKNISIGQVRQEFDFG